MLLSVASAGFSLVLEPRGRLGGMAGKAGSACEAGQKRVVYWVNVSESSGTGLPGLSRVKGR